MKTVGTFSYVAHLVWSHNVVALGVGAAALFALPEAAAAQTTHGPSACGDAPSTQTNQGVWPNGRIPYVYEAGYAHSTMVRAAMDSWQERSGHVIEFVEDRSSTSAIRIHDCRPGMNGGSASGESLGYDGCRASGCDTYLCPGNIEHELGHAIGLLHQFERSDRDHYIRLNYSSCSNGTPSFFRSSSDASDFGPFNYQSTMMYAVNDPDHIRWDGTPICASVNRAMKQLSCNDGPQGPFGAVKAGDGGAVIELYQGGSNWDRFRRTFGVGNPSPYTTDLFPETDQAGLGNNLLLADDASPAVETWGGESFAVYARTQDGRVATKSWDTGARVWTGWTILSSVPSGANISDPAVTSWGVGRTDLAVRGGDTVFIMSTPRWNTWESLGVPPGGAASAPAITSKRADEVMVVVRSNDSHMYFRECVAQCSGNQGTWSEWAVIGSEVFAGKPSIVSRGEMIDLVAHGLTDTIWLTEYRDFSGTMGWAQWGDEGRALVIGNSGCADCNSPALGSHSANSLDIYVRGLDDHLWVLTWDASLGRELETRVLGGVTTTSPGVASVATPGRADVFATMPEEVFAGRLWPGVWRKTRTSF